MGFISDLFIQLYRKKILPCYSVYQKCSPMSYCCCRWLVHRTIIVNHEFIHWWVQYLSVLFRDVLVGRGFHWGHDLGYILLPESFVFVSWLLWGKKSLHCYSLPPWCFPVLESGVMDWMAPNCEWNLISPPLNCAYLVFLFYPEESNYIVSTRKL